MSDWKPEDFAVPEDPDRDRFHDFCLPDPLLHAIADLNFEYCTPIQSAVLPASLADYDVTGQAQTGTGKTAAFLITILTRLWEEPDLTPRPPGTPRALVLAPTRELAMQIESDALDLAKYMNIGVQCVVGGIDFQKQLDRLQNETVHLLAATPGRLLDFINRRKINLRQTDMLVIDEADRMLDMGFIPDVRRIVYQTPHKRSRQTLFFSATFNDAVMRLANSWTLDPEHVVIEPEQVATETVTQYFWLVSADRKARLLADFLERAEPARALIFTNRRDQTHQLQKFLSSRNIRCESLAGDVPQRKRMSTLERFKNGDIPYVVATDVAGRGIHVDGVSHVVNFDLPEDPEDYVHRIGRTGRAGAEGVSISFVSEDDAFNLPAIETYLGNSVVCTQPDIPGAATPTAVSESTPS
ncbi:MAG: DEAD/DEAH box helicase [Pseudomonadales bacterium]|nr:DEAD/DEAH box helicase [Pseudomonadales bacterium]